MKYLFYAKNYYKANLHTHSTLSDGAMTPEEVKAAYKAKGYSILAITDHETCFSHQGMNEDGFLMLTGYELLTDQWDVPRMNMKTYHLNFIAKEPENRWQVYYPHIRPYMDQFIDQIVCDGFERRDYDVDQINSIIRRANEHGFLVFYNHPVWSLQTRDDYIGLKGLWGVEVFNGSSYYTGFDEGMHQAYQEFLCEGNRMFPLATDDAHRPDSIGWGWITVGADELTYPTVIRALENGDFYASTGPEIYCVSIEGTVLHISCSPAANISLACHGRYARRVFADGENYLTEVDLDIAVWFGRITEEWKDQAFIRLCVTDPKGNRAWTRAYWYNELVSE
ncbi:MAG: hypothetical protein IJS22_01035 [Lachnospiraceae bacterium]|nr:hypothetical protein [Lachnospiraceae bacterium]